MTLSRYRHAVYSLFFASGISGLVYEIVWLRMLSRIMGVTIYATSTVLAAFMAGLALGSFLFGRLADRRTDLLRLYALLEMFIGCTALCIPLVLTLSLSLYRSIHHVLPVTGDGLAVSALIRAPISFLALIIPTTLMGGTLPILTAYLAKKENLFGKNFSLLYGLNTLGAVLGVVISGFITLGLFGERATVLLGVAINFLVAFGASLLYRIDCPATSRAIPAVPTTTHERPVSPYPGRIRSFILVAFAASGFTALAYEIIWTRELILWLKTSIYAFAGMLSVFLVGTALGSLVMNRVVDRLKQPLVWFGAFECAIALVSCINLFVFSHLGHGGFGSEVSFAGLGTAVFSTVMLVLPLTLLFGMIFPVAGICYVKTIRDAGTSVGWLYSSNTIGSLLGSLFAGFWLVPALGSTHTVLTLALVNVGLGALLLWLEPEGRAARRLAWVAAPIVMLIGYAAVSGRDPFFETIQKRIYGMGSSPKDCTIFFHKEGVEGTVTSFTTGQRRGLWINGVGMTVLGTETKLIAHLPLLFTEDPRECLIICFGMGTTFRSASLYPELRVTAVELVPEVLQTFRFYHSDADQVVNRPNVTTTVADGRNYVLLSAKKYDVIAVDPAPPIFSAGTVNLYTREFLSLCREHLTPNGVMCLWVPGRTKQEIMSFLKTFHAVFPNASVWSGPHGWGFYLIGTIRPASPVVFEKNAKKLFSNPTLVDDLGQFDHSCVTLEQLQRLSLWSNGEIDQVSKEGVLITDDFPFTEFPLWRYLRGDRSRWQPEQVREYFGIVQEDRGPSSSH